MGLEPPNLEVLVHTCDPNFTMMRREWRQGNQPEVCEPSLEYTARQKERIDSSTRSPGLSTCAAAQASPMMIVTKIVLCDIHSGNLGRSIIIRAQPGLHSKTLSQRRQTKHKNSDQQTWLSQRCSLTGSGCCVLFLTKESILPLLGLKHKQIHGACHSAWCQSGDL